MFNDCCLCGQSIGDTMLSEHEIDFIELEGTCVDCMLITQDNARTIPLFAEVIAV